MSSQSVSDFMSRKIREPKNFLKSCSSIVAYPQNDVRKLAKIMNDIKIEYLPVLNSPWNRKIIGFIEFNKIRIFLND